MKSGNWMDEDEFFKAIDEHIAKFERADAIESARLLRLGQYLKGKDFNSVMQRLCDEHDDAYHERAYKNGYMPGPNNKLSLLLTYIEKNLEPIVTSVDHLNPFKAAEWIFSGYLFQLCVGQGSVYKIWKRVGDNYEHFMTI